MHVKVLKAFPYSHNGAHIEAKGVDDVFECRDDIVDGLIAENFVAKHVKMINEPQISDPKERAIAAISVAEAAEKNAADARSAIKGLPKAERAAATAEAEKLEDQAAALRSEADAAVAAVPAEA